MLLCLELVYTITGKFKDGFPKTRVWFIPHYATQCLILASRSVDMLTPLVWRLSLSCIKLSPISQNKMLSHHRAEGINLDPCLLTYLLLDGCQMPRHTTQMCIITLFPNCTRLKFWWDYCGNCLAKWLKTGQLQKDICPLPIVQCLSHWIHSWMDSTFHSTIHIICTHNITASIALCPSALSHVLTTSNNVSHKKR